MTLPAWLPLLASATWLHCPTGLLPIIPLAVNKTTRAPYFKQWIGGNTGDCLGPPSKWWE